MDFTSKASDKVPILFENKNYNSTSVSSLDAQQSGQQQQQQPQQQQSQSQLPIIYCVHGNLANGCCKIEKQSIVPHCHTPREEGIDKKARRKLIIACVLCICFMIVEIIGGILSNSLAIATDAAHLLTDFASFLISLFAVWLAGRPSTKRLSFGWYRAEVIGALISVLMIWVVTGVLVFWAIHRLRYQDFELDASYMLLTSIIGVIVNIIMGCALHQHGHGHGHSHGSTASTETVQHSHTAITLDDVQTSNKSTNGTNINVRAAFIHVVGDFLQSIGVFIAALVIYFKPDYIIADPICTFIFSIFVMITTFTIIKDALMVLMEGTPGYMDYEDIVQTFLQINGVKRVHNLRVWALSINKVALIAHLAIDSSSNPELILNEATARVHGKYDLFETTLQIEYFNPTMEDCTQCQLPSV